jgi:hypothetical protein
MMYSFNEIRQIFARCVNYAELEKASAAFLIVIEDGGLSKKLEEYARFQAHVRFRQLKCT